MRVTQAPNLRRLNQSVDTGGPGICIYGWCSPEDSHMRPDQGALTALGMIHLKSC